MSVFDWIRLRRRDPVPPVPPANNALEAFTTHVNERPALEQLPDPDSEPRPAPLVTEEAAENYVAQMQQAMVDRLRDLPRGNEVTAIPVDEARRPQLTVARGAGASTPPSMASAGFPTAYPFGSGPPLPRATLTPLPMPLWDREPFRFERERIQFFQNPLWQNNAFGESKHLSDTNLQQPGQLSMPTEFTPGAVNVLYESSDSEAVAALVREGTLSLTFSNRVWMQIPLRILKSLESERVERERLTAALADIFTRVEQLRSARALTTAQASALISELRTLMRPQNQGHKLNVGRQAMRFRSLENFGAQIEVAHLDSRLADLRRRIDITVVLYGLTYIPF